MSALSTPGGGGTTAQTKPTSGKQKYQKLDINSLYCANRNENSEPSSVKSQLSRKHGMQSLGKVPSARRPPANLPSLKTETGQDPNANSVTSIPTTVSTPATCTSQATTTTVASAVGAASQCGMGWVTLPPPSSPHFRTEFPSLEASAQPTHTHRATEHAVPHLQLRPQSEGSWTSGGSGGVRQESTSSPAAAPASTPASQQTPAFRAILPPFLMKGSNGVGLGLSTAREPPRGAPASSRAAPRPAATPRAVELLTARPILRDDQISSLDDISRDAGWAQQDDIDYDQKLDFSDGESAPAPSNKTNKNNNSRASMENERIVESKVQEPGDEDQLWAERRQKQSNEVAQAVARARQRKEEEQRRQMRDTATPLQPPKDTRNDRDRNDNRDRDSMDAREDKTDNRDNRDRPENRDKERTDRDRDVREKDRGENRERFDNRDRERDVRDRDRDRDRVDRDRVESRDRPRNDNRDSDKERMDVRDRDRNENRDRDRFDRDRGDRDRERDRIDRDNRDRDRDFRDRDRDYRDQFNPAFSKTFQANIPPRFMKQQQNRQQEDHNKGWAFTSKAAPRRQDQQPYTAPRHAPHNNGRRSYSRDYSDREEDFRRDKDGPGPQWRSEMQDYERTNRELDRSHSRDSYKEYDRRSESDRKSIDSADIHNAHRTSAAEKLTEVFERKSIGLAEPFANTETPSQPQGQERRNSPPSSKRESSEKDFGKTSWADVTPDEPTNYTVLKSPVDKSAPKDFETVKDNAQQQESGGVPQSQNLSMALPQQNVNQPTNTSISISSHNQTPKYHTNTTGQNVSIDQQMSQLNSFGNIQSQPISSSSSNILQPSFTDSQTKLTQSLSKPILNETVTSSTQIQRSQSSEQTTQHVPNKPVFASQKSDKEHSETETVASTISGPLTDSLVQLVGNKTNEMVSVESGHIIADSQKQRPIEDKRNDKFSNDQQNKLTVKEPIERKSSGSGSEKKSRGYGGCAYPVVYNRGWGSRESRGRRSHRSSRSNNRASESDGSTDGAPNSDRKERRRAPRSPRGPKKVDQRSDEVSRSSLADQPALITDSTETRTEPFAPRGQPSRRGRGGGFTGTSRPPAPAKRVTGYGPPNTKSPFSQANRAVKDNEDNKDIQSDDKGKANNNKARTGSSGGRGRDRRPKTAGGPLSGEDENWETTSEHSEGGVAGGRRSGGGRPSGQSKGPMGRNHNSGNRQMNGRNIQGAKKDNIGEFKTSDITEAMTEMKLTSNKKDEDIVDDGFQEVRNKKNSKDIRTPPAKEETQHSKQPRSHSNSNQGGGRNGSSSRNSSDKSRGPAPVPGKPNSQYDRSRQANLAPRFVKQRQKQQMGLMPGFGPDTGAAPPPPAVNAWDKPISQTLRGSVEEAPESTENKSGQTSQRSTPADATIENKTVTTTPCAVPTDKVGVLDGTTPPVETIIFENTNYKTAPPAEALKQKYQPSASTAKPQHQGQHQGEEITPEIDARTLAFNGDVRAPPRTIQELIADNSRPVTDGDNSLGLPISFDTAQKAEDSSDMKLDFAFDSDLGQLTEDKSAKLGLPRGPHMSTSNTISPLAADLNLKIASVKKVWEMPAVIEGGEELQFAGFTEENNADTGAPPNVCKVKPTQQLQSPPPQHYNHVGYQGGYSGLSVPSPPALVFNSSQQLLGSSQQLQQQGGLYGAFLDQSRGQFGGFPGSPYGAGNATPYNYQPPPDMFQSLPSQYRMAAAGGGAAFGQSGQLGNSPSTVLISSTSNSLMSATVKPSTQQIGAIGSKGGGVSTYQQQYLGYSGPVGEAPYSLPGLMTRPAPPASSYYSPYQPPTAPAPTYPLQFTQPTQSGAYQSQFLSSQLQVAAAVQQMQQQYRAPLQPQYAAPPQPAPRPPPQQQLKSPLHDHANGFAPLCEAPSPTPKGVSKPQKPPHSPPHHKYHVPPPHAHPPHQQPHQQHHHQQHQQQALGGGGGNNGRGGNMPRGGMAAPRYPAPIQRPLAPPYRGPPAPPRHHGPRHTHNLYYQQRKCASGGERADGSAQGAAADEPAEPTAVDAPQPAEVKAD